MTYPWRLLCFFTLITLLATSNRSFWIDECITAKYATYGGLSEAWTHVLSDKFSEVQMPFYITYVWAFEKVFGHSELALRLTSLPFFVGGMTLLAFAFRQRWGRAWPVMCAGGLSPFAWYYLNEARPYALQVGLACMIVACLIRLSEISRPLERPNSRWLVLYLLSLVLLSGSNMLGQLWAGAGLLAALVVIPRSVLMEWWSAHRGKLAFTASILLILGLYYVWSLSIGARATKGEPTNVKSVAFIAYELLGFTGLGPGRNELRFAKEAAIKPFAINLAIYGCLVGLVMLAGLKSLLRNELRYRTLGGFACVLLPTGLILLAGLLTDFRVLGRHFAPLSVIPVLILSVGLIHIAKHWRWAGRWIIGGFTAVTLVSCLLVRFSPRHGKDDYRQAVALALEAIGRSETVWWNAHDSGANYYSLPLASPGSAGGSVIKVSNPMPGFEEGLPVPDIVIVSKADLFDNQAVLATYLRENGYQASSILMAFTIYKKPFDRTD